MNPSWRKPAGALIMLVLITAWAILIVSLAQIIANWPMVVQMMFYAVTGVIWIFPMKPLLQWMETGRFR